VVECGGLENRLARKGHGGSNPSSSASKLKTTLKLPDFSFAQRERMYVSFITVLSQRCRKPLGPKGGGLENRLPFGSQPRVRFPVEFVSG
jgi:hypothetical protein